jgi:hypothetical protein
MDRKRKFDRKKRGNKVEEESSENILDSEVYSYLWA